MSNHALDEALAQLERGRAEAQAQADAFMAAINAIRSLPNTNGSSPAPTLALNHSAVPSGDMWLSPDASSKDAAIFALRRIGRPAKIREVYDEATAAGWKYSGQSYDAFRSTLAKLMSRNSRFTKAKKGLWMLSGARSDG